MREACISRRGMFDLSLERYKLQFKNQKDLSDEEIFIKCLVDWLRTEGGKTPSQNHS